MATLSSDACTEAERRYGKPESRVTESGRCATANEIAAFIAGTKWEARRTSHRRPRGGRSEAARRGNRDAVATAVERMQAAIDKLETLKAVTPPGPWATEHVGGAVLLKPVHRWYGEGGEGLMHPDDALLILTLHRTIDAQLAILRSVLEACDVERNWETLVYTIDALALADAILGELA